MKGESGYRPSFYPSGVGADDMTGTPRHASGLRARVRFLGFLTLLGLAMLTVGHSREAPVRAEAQNRGDEPALSKGEVPAPVANVVRQGFPAGKADPSDLTKSDTAWEIEWELTHPFNKPLYPPGSVLRIRSAK